MICPICKTEHHIHYFQQRKCPVFEYDGSGWNPLYEMNNYNRIPNLKSDSEVCKKVYFGTMGAALEHIQRIGAKSDRDRKPIRAYLCHKCKCWHLTHWEAPDVQKVLKEISAEIRTANERSKKLAQENERLINKINYLKKLIPNEKEQ